MAGSNNILEIAESFFHSLKIKGNRNVIIHNLGLLNYETPNMLSYINNPKFLNNLKSNENIAACFISDELYHKEELPDKITYLVINNPDHQFYLFQNFLYQNTDFYGLKKENKIAESAVIENGVQISSFNVTIGKNVYVGHNAVILGNTIIEDNVYIGPNCSIGIEGTQVIKDEFGRNIRVHHAGGVLIKEGTFIGANTVIVKSLFKEKTEIGENCSIGNLVNVGHNCKIGNNVLLLANSVVCGSTTIGDGARISPGSFIASSKVIGADSFITLGSVVSQNVSKGERVSGNFAIPHQKFLQHIKKISS